MNPIFKTPETEKRSSFNKMYSFVKFFISKGVKDPLFLAFLIVNSLTIILTLLLSLRPDSAPEGTPTRRGGDSDPEGR